jgi:predicted regulator of Ras-like GTPase activity (Roadblock/LC7/MglB family)
MNRLTPFAILPEVKDAVISDMEGTLIEHTPSEDAESIAAVMSFFVNGIAECGDALGFGEPLKVCCSGKEFSYVLLVQDKKIWSFFLDPTASQSTFEKKVDAIRAKNTQSKRGGLK